MECLSLAARFISLFTSVGDTFMGCIVDMKQAGERSIKQTNKKVILLLTRGSRVSTQSVLMGHLVPPFLMVAMV